MTAIVEMIRPCKNVRSRSGKVFNMSEFWTGSLRSEPNQTNWRGDFRGRPSLMQDLMPAIHHLATDWANGTLHQLRTAFRTFFRFLDAIEEHVQPIENLAQITEQLARIWLHPIENRWPEPPANAFAQLGQIVFVARQFRSLDIELFHWPVITRHQKNVQRDTITKLEARAALRLLKDHAYTIFRRWDEADDLIARGRNLLNYKLKGKCKGFGFQLNRADLYATYKAIIEATGKAIPDINDVRRALGFGETDGGTVPHCWMIVGATLTEIRAGTPLKRAQP